MIKNKLWLKITGITVLILGAIVLLYSLQESELMIGRF
jgi:hypothetical protein